MEIFIPEDDSEIIQQGPVRPTIPLSDQERRQIADDAYINGILDEAEEKGNFVLLSTDGYLKKANTA